MHLHEHDHAPDAAARRAPEERKRRDEETRALRAVAAREPRGLDHAAALRLQRIAGNAGVEALVGEREEDGSLVHDVVNSGRGRPLDPSTRAEMETRLGQDFGDVRVHTDSLATESAKAVRADAYTVGTDVVFRSDKYSPETEAGKRTLAHELTHVVQQKAGAVSGTPARGGVNISDPSDRFEQDAVRSADRAMAAPSAAAGAAAPAASAGVQRQAAGEDELELQGEFVQRQEELPEEEEEEVPEAAA